MATKFPSADWLKVLEDKLNTDEHYAKVASKWESDMCVVIDPSGPLQETIIYYLDLWHGKCRRSEMLPTLEGVKAAFILRTTYDNIVKVITGVLDPITAMMTRRLQVQGNMAVMMRNVPVVLDFVRCCREIDSDILS
jgi:putative sterol carrier protein